MTSVRTRSGLRSRAAFQCGNAVDNGFHFITRAGEKAANVVAHVGVVVGE